MYSLATREEDNYVCSFVDMIIYSLFYAREERIDSLTSEKMPSVSLFGNDLKWALRDVINSVGNYHQIYSRNIEGYENLKDNRNQLNVGADPKPQIFPLPGLRDN